MKTLYVDDRVHMSLKLLASATKRKLSDVVQDCLDFALRRKVSDLPPELLAHVAMQGGSFDFLKDPREEVYSAQDGKPIAR